MMNNQFLDKKIFYRNLSQFMESFRRKQYTLTVLSSKCTAISGHNERCRESER